MTFDEKKEANVKFSNIAYYLIIAGISIIITGFVPMLGSEIGLKWNLPDTTAGWIVWVVSKLLIATSNMIIFYCFNEQAKVNIKENPKYKEATEILHRAYKKKEVLPRSPKEWTTKTYITKGGTLFLSSIMSSVGLAQAVLTFDLVTFLALLFTIVMSVVFGYLQMKKAEDYWTSEYYEYALMMRDKLDEVEEKMRLESVGALPTNENTIIEELTEESKNDAKNE